MFDAATLARTFDTDSSTLAQRVLQATKDTTVTEDMRPLLESPIGRLLSNEELFKSRRIAEARYDEEVAADLAALAQLVRETTPELEAAIQAAQELPATSLARWLVTKGRSDHGAEEWLLSSIRSELVRSRLDAELKTATASTVHRTYLSAVAENDVEVLAHVEAKVLGGWAPVPTDDDAEINAALALRKAINETRAARVPHDLRALETAITNTRRLLDKIRTAKPGGHARTRG